jgi:hypothetical protein
VVLLTLHGNWVVLLTSHGIWANQKSNFLIYAKLLNRDETELRAFFVALTLPLSIFFSHKKERHRIKKERAVMATKKYTEFRFI